MLFSVGKYDLLCWMVAHLKIRRNSLKTRASSSSSSTSPIIAFKVKWFWGAPSFSIMYWILWLGSCCQLLHNLHLNVLNIMIRKLLSRILTLSSVRPIFWDCSQQYSLNFFSRSLISLMKHLVLSHPKVFHARNVARKISSLKSTPDYYMFTIYLSACQVEWFNLYVCAIKHQRQITEKRTSPSPWKFCKLQVDICPMTLLHWSCFPFIYIWADKEDIFKYEPFMYIV